jgi:HPt (histidine-containing phosphotransfer) domain-containing protein
MIDWQRVDDIRREIGLDDFAEVVAMFLEETDEVVARLPSQTGAALRADLHFLKGSALNLGFRKVAQSCGQGESALREGRAAVVGEIVTLYRETRAAFLSALPPDQIRNSARISSLVMSR